MHPECLLMEPKTLHAGQPPPSTPRSQVGALPGVHLGLWGDLGTVAMLGPTGQSPVLWVCLSVLQWVFMSWGLTLGCRLLLLKWLVAGCMEQVPSCVLHGGQVWLWAMLVPFPGLSASSWWPGTLRFQSPLDVSDAVASSLLLPILVSPWWVPPGLLVDMWAEPWSWP